MECNAVILWRFKNAALKRTVSCRIKQANYGSVSEERQFGFLVTSSDFYVVFGAFIRLYKLRRGWFGTPAQPLCPNKRLKLYHIQFSLAFDISLSQICTLATI